MTEAENLLWYYLRAERFLGFKFRRQVPIEGYVADFACVHPPVIIEVDGGGHTTQQEKDKIRDEVLRKRGYKVLRFWNNEVFENIEGVSMTIKNALETSPLPHPSPARGRGEKVCVL